MHGLDYGFKSCFVHVNSEAVAGHVPVYVTEQIIRKEMFKIRHNTKIKAKDCESTEEDKSENSRRSERSYYSRLRVAALIVMCSNVTALLHAFHQNVLVVKYCFLCGVHGKCRVSGEGAGRSEQRRYYYLNYAVSIDSAIVCKGPKTCVKKATRERKGGVR